ncbi:MAG: TetR/AcrR family transcriptional regulator [Novosphingobium sp.]
MAEGARRAEAGSRQRKRKERTREAIIEAAAATFLRKGVAGATVAEIAEAADVGYGTFYNHFQGLQDVVSAVAERTMARIVEMTEDALPEEGGQELVPAISLRIIVRLMTRDPSIRWLLERPYVFADEWQKIITPSMQRYRERAPDDSVFTAMGGPGVWIRMLPWILIGELNDAIEKGESAEHEENLANMSLHLLGLSETRRLEMVDASRRIVDSAGLPSARPDAKK